MFYGAHRRWRWLVDPPEELWFCYTQSLLKGLLGIGGLRKFTFVLGIIFVAVGVYGIAAQNP